MTSLQDKASGYVLQVTAGKDKGREMPLFLHSALTIGRDEVSELVLDEDMVSRQHARIHIEPGKIFIEDLRSTNGTFVNGAQVSRTDLVDGDRILIGTSLLRLVTAYEEDGDTVSVEQPPSTANEVDSNATRIGPPPSLKKPSHKQSNHTQSDRRKDGSAIGVDVLDSESIKPSATIQHHAQVPLQGSLSSFAVVDLLRWASRATHSGVVVLSHHGDEAKVFMRDGQVVFATLSSASGLPARKTLGRILNWFEGSFDWQPWSRYVDPDVEEPFRNPLRTPTELLLDELTYSNDGARWLGPEVPPQSAQLRLAHPLTLPLHNLSVNELDVLQLVHNRSSVREVYDQSFLDAAEISQILVKLMHGDYVRLK